jgi:hypothetical protein
VKEVGPVVPLSEVGPEPLGKTLDDASAVVGLTGNRDRIAMEMNRGAKHDMTITIRLSDDEQRRLAERAARNGRDVADYVRLLIERDIQEPPAVDQALAPFRRQVEESGMTDDELGDFFEDVREEVWQEKHGRPSKTS